MSQQMAVKRSGYAGEERAHDESDDDVPGSRNPAGFCRDCAHSQRHQRTASMGLREIPGDPSEH